MRLHMHSACCVCNIQHDVVCAILVDVTKRRTSAWLDRSEADREAWNTFRKAAAAVISHVDTDLQQHLKVGYTDVDALLHLSVADDHCLRMATLARGVSRSPSALTRLVDRLEQRSLVARTRHSSTDVSVEVTPEGLDLLAEASPRILEEVEQRFWSRLTPTERHSLSTLCRKLLDTDQTDC